MFAGGQLADIMSMRAVDPDFDAEPTDAISVAIGAAILVLTLAIVFLGTRSVSPVVPLATLCVVLTLLVLATAGRIAKSRLRRSQEEMSIKNAHLEELANDFLAGVSHELKIPTAAMLGLSATLTDMWNELDENAKRGLTLRLVSNAEHLNSLITELVDLSRLEAGLGVPELKPVDVSAEIRAAAVALSIALNHHRLQIMAPPSVMALGDRVGIRRSIEALLSNAGKFSPPGSLIIVRAHESGEEVTVSVDDNGVGIPDEEVEKIFDSFYRIRGSNDVRVGGMGIGLAVAKRYVESMGGRIWVEAVGGRGSTFSFTLIAYSGAVPAGHHSKLTSPIRTSSPLLAPASPSAPSTPARSSRP